MAKIYEKPIDLERDRLNDKATSERSEVNHSLFWGTLSAFTGSSFLQDAEKTKLHPPVSPGRWEKFTNATDKPFGWALIAMSTFWGGMAIKQFFDAKNTREQLTKLGPEEVILPGGEKLDDLIRISQQADNVSMGKHASRALDSKEVSNEVGR